MVVDNIPSIGGSKVGKAYAVEQPERCEVGPWVKARCVHGDYRRGRVPCGDRSRCLVCAGTWSRKVRKRIIEGAREAGELWFVTITACSHGKMREGYSCAKCGSDRPGLTDPDEFQEAWKRLRKALWRDDRTSRWFRVLEVGDKGRLHLHMVTDSKRMVGVLKAKDKESLASYWKRQSATGRELIGEFIGAGFGTIAHVQRCRSGIGGAAKYFTKYLAKGSETIPRHADGRSVRVAEGSRNWLSQRSLREYQFSGSAGSSPGLEVDLSCECGKKHKSIRHVQACRREVQRVWMGQYLANRAGCLQLVARHKERAAAFPKTSPGSAERFEASAAVKVAILRLRDVGCWVPLGWLVEQSRKGNLERAASRVDSGNNYGHRRLVA